MTLKYKMVLAGSKDVGKSSLIARFCDNVFDEKSMDTIGVAFKRKKVQIRDDLGLELSIWDFGGEEKYRVLFPNYLNGAAAALICFDITRKETLNDVKNWVELIDANTDEKIIKLLIATKIDLEDERQISDDEAKETAKKFNCMGDPIFTSAKTGENVEDAFLSVANKIMDIHFTHCDSCGNVFSKKLNICNYCGN